MACNLLAAMIVGDIYAAKPFHPLGNHDCRDQQALVGRQALFCGNWDGNYTVYFPLAELGEDIFFLF